VAKRTTKRDVILEGIDREIASVKTDIATAEAEMAVYRSNLSSLYAVEHALEKLRKQTVELLAPQSRQPRKTKPATRTVKGELCGRCQGAKNHFIHSDKDAEGYHEFVSPAKLTKKLSPKKRAGLPTSPSEDLMDRRPAPDEMCAYISDDGRGNGAECRSVQADPIHDKSMGYGGYHPFQPLPSAAHSAQPLSSANGVESNGTASSEVETVAAGVAAHGASERG
jgi:hypothetical protein